MGTPRSHLARLAARTDRLARKIRAHSVGLCGDRAALVEGRARFLLVENRASESRVRTILKKSGANLDAVDFFRVPTDRGWMRDSGPICMRNEAGEVAYNHFVFNGWAKYPNHKRDAAAVTKVNQKLKRRVCQPVHNGRRVVLEGGSIDVNGRGTLLTTERMSPQQSAGEKSGFH